jgi:preprotein translocase subunit SecG
MRNPLRPWSKAQSRNSRMVMYYALLFIHIIICIIMIGSILMQAGKGGGLAGGAFGGGASMSGGGSQLFGGGGAATFLTKVTSYAAVVFFLTCIGLWFTARSANPIPESAAERMLREQQTPIPISQPVQIPIPTGSVPGLETTPE